MLYLSNFNYSHLIIYNYIMLGDDKKTLLIFLAIFIILIILVILTIMQLTEGNSKKINLIYTQSVPGEKIENVPEKRYIPDQSAGILQTFNPVQHNRDAIRDYDYNKLYDPLTEPTRRIPRYEIPPVHLKRLLDIPTRGYPDNFTQFGILMEEGKRNKDSDNKILRLFGRHEFPGSNRYEYYTAINSGLDQIKIPVIVKQQELYDDDDVYIEELGKRYRVRLHRFDAPKYYPDLIY
jgi:hypothetical protein